MDGVYQGGLVFARKMVSSCFRLEPLARNGAPAAVDTNYQPHVLMLKPLSTQAADGILRATRAVIID